MDLSKLLSGPQLLAATTLDVPVCILAGAGSGKTRVITHRIAFLIEELRAQPESILAVTFTNKAAGEMRHRVEKLVPGRGSRVQVGTFHGIAARWLRRFGRGVGVNPSFVIYDADDANRLLTRVCTQELNFAKDVVTPISRRIDAWQNEGLLPTQIPTEHDLIFDRGLQAYALYLERLSAMGALDFGGLLLKMRELLQSPAGEEVRQRVRHVLVDEYQDTSAVQADIVLNIARAARTVAVVGDDDQAIYGWRGASADNLKRFLQAMPGAELVKLEDNYRSTGAILDAANGIIAENSDRLGKVLRATGERGRPVRIIRARDDLEESRRVVRLIGEHQRAGFSLDEAAILYRTNACSRPFEDELRREGLRYRVVGGVRFYDRKEVKDVLATVRAALNPLSDVDTVRFLAAVPRGIGATTMEKVEAAARKAKLSLMSALGDEALLTTAGLSPRHVTKATAIATQLGELAAKITGAKAVSARDAVALAIEVSGVADRLEAEKSIEAEGRLENLHELLSAAAAHGEIADAQNDVTGFLEAAALLGTNEAAEKDDGRGQVTLMSLHAAKGLEFDLVFLAALEEHGFPHSRALVENAPPSELEEERRLAYVGITRARQRLVLSYADFRMVQGQKKRRQPSRFLSEIPRDVVDGDVPPRRSGSMLPFGGGLFPRGEPSPIDDDEPRVEYDAEFTGVGRRREPRTQLYGTAPPTAPRVDPRAQPLQHGFARVAERLAGSRPAMTTSAPSSPSPIRRPLRDETAQRRVDDAPAISTGARVWHKSFGEGSVVGVRGNGGAASALVRFDGDRQPRMIIARHLEALEGPLPGHSHLVLEE